MGNVIKAVPVRVLITELPTLVEKKLEQTDLNDTPKSMSFPLMTYLLFRNSKCDFKKIVSPKALTARLLAEFKVRSH